MKSDEECCPQDEGKVYIFHKDPLERKNHHNNNDSRTSLTSLEKEMLFAETESSSSEGVLESSKDSSFESLTSMGETEDVEVKTDRKSSAKMKFRERRKCISTACSLYFSVYLTFYSL
jgi:hypothetical protein